MGYATHDSKITICLSTYNGAKYIHEQLDTPLKQTVVEKDQVIIEKDRAIANWVRYEG